MTPCAILLNHCNSSNADKAKALAKTLRLEIVAAMSTAFACYLIIENDRIGCLIPSIAQKPYFVDFLSDQLSYRQQQAKKELIVRACQPKGLTGTLNIIDATAGFGRDSFMLAAGGAQVVMLERNPIVATLLQDGLDRLKNTNLSSPALSLITQDAITYFGKLSETTCPDVIYLDPMFEEERNAKVKKDLQILQWLLANDTMDANQLFQSAYATQAKRIVVKRAINAPFLAQHKPSFSLSGKHTRFDVYCRQ